MENKKSERDLKLIRFPIMCYQYEKLGICNYHQCCYAHTYDEIIFCKEQIKLRSIEKKRQKNGICYEFRMYSTCKYGEECKFAHCNNEEEIIKIENMNQHQKDLKQQKEQRKEERKRKKKEEKKKQQLERKLCKDQKESKIDKEDDIDDCYHQNFTLWVKRLITSSNFYKDKQVLFDQIMEILISWKLRFADDPAICTRIFKRRGKRLLKELEESLLVIEKTMKALEQMKVTADQGEKKATIIDLCSGFGYTSMLLSELLPATKVKRIILIDKDFPHHSQAHMYSGDTSVEKHINWTHLHHPDWPIPLIPRKNNIKKTKREFDFIARNYLNESPVFILAIHLCGTLSLRACDMFNKYPSVTMIVLKPCCLPSLDVAKQQEYLGSGSHQFKATDVCTAGKWTCNGWEGPPRHYLGMIISMCISINTYIYM